LLDAAALCRHLVAEDSMHAFLADHRGELFPDELFADLFPSGRGRPSVPADVIATVMVLQALEGLSDRDAAAQLRTNIAWKVAAGLALDDGGLHYSVLTYWRTRLRQSTQPERIFDAVRSVIDATGVLKGRRRRALDSTLLDDAVATQDTVTQLVSAIRRVRRLVPTAAAVEITAHDYDASGKPVCAWDDPDAKAALVSGLVNDARAIIAALDAVVLNDEQADAVGLLALVAGQDVEPGEGEGTWRIAQRVAPDRVISTVDPESRHMHKSVSEYRDGFKAHLAVEPETGLITACALTPANTADGPTGVELLADEKPGLQVLADSAYGSGEVRSALRRAKHRAAIKAIPLRRAVPGGFDRDDFIIDHTARTATCPAGHTVNITTKGAATFGVRCAGCPLRQRCTTAKDGRTLRIGEHDAELVEARRALARW
jgi:IS5 family transposase